MKMDIELISEKPIKTKPYRMSPRQINILKDEIKRLLDLGVIEIGQPDFTSPLILVESIYRVPRPCVDYRRLNGITRIEFFPLPNIDENCGKGWRLTICDGLSRLE
ncbi:retrovirus-related Pol polyprotein from transposon 17.6 [Trichonephila inaurata madagascariensis]|uniref:Retrovirus-related Pol polyprotein from transposon 17.6 n=1 Tax=Trichonephila inaurata madagascariensis TaxID=2747483 RepID=A0A8X6X1G3_9ARAC|nr:retrovirus-related Pol polyprotein from transposon 17.6 [Trichonephila inaurata madagascariensis]